MEVKGTAVSTIPEFVKSRFGEEGFKKWFQALPAQAKDVYQWKALPNMWYPIKEVMTEPTELICSLFYNGDLKGAFESGSYSAEWGLKGIYRLFVKLGSPEFIIGRSGVIMPTYYRPSKMETVNLQKGKVMFRITEFPEISKVVEYRIAGWIQRALELSGAKHTRVSLQKSMTENNPASEILAEWQ